MILNIYHLKLQVKERKGQKLLSQTVLERKITTKIGEVFLNKTILSIKTVVIRNSLPLPIADEQAKTAMVKAIRNWPFHARMDFYYLFITD